MRATRSPPRPFRSIAPRQKPRLYKYYADDNPDLNKIVIDIIEGLPIDQVDPEIYPTLLPLLKERHLSLQEWRNQPASRSLNQSINYINNYRYSNDPKQLRPRSERSANFTNCNAYNDTGIADRQIRKGKTVSQNEINANIDYALKGKYEMIDPDLYGLLSTELNKMRDDSLSMKRYNAAEQAEIAARHILTLGSESIFDDFTSQNLQVKESHLFDTQMNQEELRCIWDEVMKNAEIKRENEIKNMDAEFEKEMAEFDKQFNVGPPSTIFKYSSQVLDLRKRESYMVKAKRYNEAKEMNNEATRLEKIEREQHQRKWYEELNLARVEHEKKLREKYKIRRDNLDKNIMFLKQKMDRALEQNEKAIMHAEFNVDGASTIRNLSDASNTHNTSTVTRTASLASLSNSIRDYSPRASARGINDPNFNSRLPPLHFANLHSQTTSTPAMTESFAETAALAISARKTARRESSRRTLSPCHTPAQQFRKKAIMNTIVYTKTSNNLGIS